MGAGTSTEQAPTSNLVIGINRLNDAYHEALVQLESSKQKERQIQSKLDAKCSEVVGLRARLNELTAALSAAETNTVSADEHVKLRDRYEKLLTKHTSINIAFTGSRRKLREAQQAHKEEIQRLEAELKTVRNGGLQQLKQNQAQEKERNVVEKELIAAELEKFKTQAAEEKRQRQKLLVEHKKLAEQVYNRTRIIIENIPIDYSYEEVIEKILIKGQHLIHWDENPDMMLRLSGENSQRCVAYLENVQAAEAVFQRWNGVMDGGQKIRVSYAACTKMPTPTTDTVKGEDPKKSEEALPKPTEAISSKPQCVTKPLPQVTTQKKIDAWKLGLPNPSGDTKDSNRRILCVIWLPEQMTDAELLTMAPSWDAGYEMKNGRPHTERLRTEKGIIGFIFFKSVEKAQQCMKTLSQARPPNLPYDFSYYGNAAHINALLRQHLNFESSYLF